VAVDRVIVNAVVPPPFPPGAPDLDARLARLPDLPGLPPAAVMAGCAAQVRERAELNRQYTEEVGRDTGLPTTSLPFLVEGIRGQDDLRRLALPLIAEPDPGVEAA
jgi:hypothetical protein